MSRRVFLFKRFERFWHWMQALLVLLLIYTGFEVHGTLNWLGYERAVFWHNHLVWLLIILIVFAIFWHFTTGAWRHYRPAGGNLGRIIRYYQVGIFRNEPHPTRKTEISKLNPLQRLTYLGLKILIFPVQIISGFIYYFHDDLQAAGFNIDLGIIAFIHTAAAFILLIFFIAHVYLATTGQTAFSNIRAMITGWEEMEEDDNINPAPTGQ